MRINFSNAKELNHEELFYLFVYIVGWMGECHEEQVQMAYESGLHAIRERKKSKQQD